MTETEETPTVTSKNLNTILLFGVIGLLGFVGTSSYQHSIALAKLEVSQVSRPELDARFAEIRVEQVKIETELVDLRMKIITVEHEAKVLK